jgi:Family of unknown function (DUF6262)
MTASRPGNPGNLQKAAAGRTAAAITRAEAALDQMLRTGQPVTFRGLAAAAPVSLDFLYRCAAIRQRIEQARAQPHARPAHSGPGQPASVIAALTGELAELKRRRREQVAELERALRAAHGENLILRRRLGQQRQQPSAPANDRPQTDR